MYDSPLPQFFRPYIQSKYDLQNCFSYRHAPVGFKGLVHQRLTIDGRRLTVFPYTFYRPPFSIKIDNYDYSRR